MNELLKRILTSLLLLPILLFSLFEYNFIFFLLLLISSFLMANELLKITESKNIKVYKSITLGSVILIIFYFYLIEISEINLLNLFLWIFKDFKLGYQFVILVFFISTMIIFIIQIFSFNLKKALEAVSIHVFTIGYCALSLGYILWLEKISPFLVLYLLIVTWMTDIGAYFIGKYFGKHKLNLKISPNKTIEGLIGGLISSLIFSIILKNSFDFYESEMLSLFSGFIFIILTLSLSILAILGDLAESAIKRSGNIKNSQNYIPGHGGMLDIMDSLVYTAPIFYFILKWNV